MSSPIGSLSAVSGVRSAAWQAEESGRRAARLSIVGRGVFAAPHTWTEIAQKELEGQPPLAR
jgi:hypothetical protein